MVKLLSENVLNGRPLHSDTGGRLVKLLLKSPRTEILLSLEFYLEDGLEMAIFSDYGTKTAHSLFRPLRTQNSLRQKSSAQKLMSK